MRIEDHLLFQAQKAYMFEIFVFASRDRVLDASCTGTDQDVAHQLIEPMSFNMFISHLKGPFFINYLLSVIFSNFPLSLHLFDFILHVSLMLLSLFNLFHFTI